MAAVPIHLPEGVRLMQAAIAPRGDARAFLTHFVGSGLDDDCYVVEKFRSLANGDIVPVNIDQVARKSRCNTRRMILIADGGRENAPARDEIIIATGVKLRRCRGPALGLALQPIPVYREVRMVSRCEVIGTFIDSLI